MGAIRAAFASLALLAATPAHADQVTRWRPYIAEASGRFGVPVEWIERVIRAESAGFTTLDGRPITSHAGAMGLMQLMPGTWAQMRVALRLGADPYDPRDNILAGSAYLRLMYDRFGYPGLFAAYNAGPARYAGYLAGVRTLPGETRAYLMSVGGVATGTTVSPQTVVSTTLFFALLTAPSGEGDDRSAAPTLFVPIGAAAAHSAPAAR